MAKSTWLVSPPGPGGKWRASLYRGALAVACVLTTGSLILQIGFAFPDAVHAGLIWVNFLVVCLFFILVIMETAQAIRTRRPIRYLIFELFLILFLIGEFVFLRSRYSGEPWRPGSSVILIQIYLLVLQAYFIWVLIRRGYEAGRRLFFLSFTPAATVSLSFILLILIGTALLMLPRATHGGLVPNISFLDALFTSTSAVCVTGLTVVDTATRFSQLGQIFIVLLIQLGGFGIMTFVGIFMFTFGQSSSLRGRLVMQDILVREGGQQVASFLRIMLLNTFLFELVGTAFLAVGFYSRWHAWPDAFFAAVFHSVSAFCNAGFSTFSNNLESFRDSPLIVLTVSSLIIAGGIGFTVQYELTMRVFHFVFGKRNSPLSLHTRVVLRVTAVLLAGGMLAVWWGGDWSRSTWLETLLASFFHSVSARTAGFNTIPLAWLAPWTIVILMILMFIGGAPGGTAGGIKVSTAGMLYYSTRSLLKGRPHIEIMGRTIGQQAVHTAFVVSGLATAFVALSAIALVYAEPEQDFLVLLFEVLSAFGTVGLSLGVTPELSPLGKMILILTMYVGRVGPLTLVLGLIKKKDEALYTYPSGTIVIG